MSTVPNVLTYINPTYLKNKGYESGFFENRSYFTTYGDVLPIGIKSKGPVLTAEFKKGGITIQYGLFYAGCPPMVVSVNINGKKLYRA